MKTEDIKKMAQAWLQVQEASKKKMDPVDQDELKGTHAQRKDKDINNDGKSDKTDEYLHNRRKAVSAAIKGKKKDQEVEVQTSEATVNELSKKTLGSYVKKASAAAASDAAKYGQQGSSEKGLKHFNKAYDRLQNIKKATDKLTKEEVEELDELKKSTLSSYIKKASGDMAGKTAVQVAKVSSSNSKPDPDLKRGLVNRMKGIGRAADKLAKESVEEAATHKPGVSSPAGEGLSPSAKKELARKTEAPASVDINKVLDLDFKTFKSMGKNAQKRSNDQNTGDKNIVK